MIEKKNTNENAGTKTSFNEYEEEEKNKYWVDTWFERIEIMIQRNLKKNARISLPETKNNTKHIRRKATKKKQTNNLVL